MKNITISTIAVIALTVLAPAAEPEAKPAAEPAATPAADAAAGDVAKQLEKQVIGYWAPDTEAMVKHVVEKMGMKKEEAQAMTEELSNLTFHAELGTVHMYSEQGIVAIPYEIVKADKAAGSLTLRALNPRGGGEAQPLELLIKDKQITVAGGGVPVILKNIDEAEFTKRKNAVPAHKVGP